MCLGLTSSISGRASWVALCARRVSAIRIPISIASVFSILTKPPRYSLLGRYIILKLSNKNVGLNVGLNKTEKAVLRLLIEDSDRTADMIATEIGVTKRTIERTLVSLQKKEK